MHHRNKQKNYETILVHELIKTKKKEGKKNVDV